MTLLHVTYWIVKRIVPLPPLRAAYILPEATSNMWIMANKR